MLYEVITTIGRADIIVLGMLMIGGIGAILSTILEYIENRFVKGGA